jgi:hypothetical protein
MRAMSGSMGVLGLSGGSIARAGTIAYDVRRKSATRTAWPRT